MKRWVLKILLAAPIAVLFTITRTSALLPAVRRSAQRRVDALMARKKVIEAQLIEMSELPLRQKEKRGRIMLLEKEVCEDQAYICCMMFGIKKPELTTG